MTETRNGARRGTLHGRRVVVTRAEEQAGLLGDGLRARGAVPRLVPSIRYLPTDPAPLAVAAREIDRAAWVVFTSATGVAYGSAAVLAAWPGGLPAGVRVAAVGPGTAAACAAAGFPADFVPRDALGDALASDLPLEPGDRVVLLRSDIGRRAVAAGLAARGADVRDVAAYRTVESADPDAVAEALADAPDAVTFTSPSTVRGFVAAVPDPFTLASTRLVAIGPVTADALVPFGLRAAAVARPHTVPGLLATLDALFS